MLLFSKLLTDFVKSSTRGFVPFSFIILLNQKYIFYVVRSVIFMRNLRITLIINIFATIFLNIIFSRAYPFRFLFIISVSITNSGLWHKWKSTWGYVGKLKGVVRVTKL